MANEPAAGATRAGRAPRSRALTTVAAVVAGIVAIGLMAVLEWPASATPDQYRAARIPGVGTGSVALSSDGRLLAVAEPTDPVLSGPGLALVWTATETVASSNATSQVDVRVALAGAPLGLAFVTDGNGTELVVAEAHQIQVFAVGTATTTISGTAVSTASLNTPLSPIRSNVSLPSGSISAMVLADRSHAYVLVGGNVVPVDLTAATISAAPWTLPDTYDHIAYAASTVWLTTDAPPFQAIGISTSACSSTGCTIGSDIRLDGVSQTTATRGPAITVNAANTTLFAGGDTTLVSANTHGTAPSLSTTYPKEAAGYPTTIPTPDPWADQHALSNYTGCSAIALAADGSTLYCTADGSGGTGSNLYWFDTATLAYRGALNLTSLGATGTAAPELAVSGSRVYLALNSTANAIASVPLSAITNASIPLGTVPQAPANVAVTPGNTQLTVTWATPLTTGGTALTGFTVVATPPSGAPATCTTGPSARSCTITGLANWTAYSVTVTATNAVGTGPASAAISQAPGVPGAPGLLTVTPASEAMTVSWQPPTNSGAALLTGYLVTAQVDTSALPTPTATPTGTSASATTPVSGACTPNPGPAATSCTITGLHNGNGKRYIVTVRALNLSSQSSCNPLSAPAGTCMTSLMGTPASITTVVGVPSSPQNLTATPSDSTLDLAWTPPAISGSSSLTGYDVLVMPGSFTCGSLPATANSCTVEGLTNGTAYTVSVTAKNTAGSSTPATLSNIVPAAVPGPPSNVKATPGDGTAIVTWDAPTATGGSPLTSYIVTLKSLTGSSKNCTVAASAPRTCTITGLTNGLSYGVAVVAVNAQGQSVPSSDAASVTPAGMPLAPTGISVLVNGTDATVQWTAADADGGTNVSYLPTLTPATATGCGETVATSCSLTALVPGTTYSISLATKTSVGVSDDSAPVTFSVIGAPGKPVEVARKGVYKRTKGHLKLIGWRLSLRWTVPKTDAIITGYSVSRSFGSARTVHENTITFRKLTSGTYRFWLVALSGANQSVRSDVLVIHLGGADRKG